MPQRKVITITTAQDLQEAIANNNLEKFILQAIDEHRKSDLYNGAIEADAYFDGENPFLLSRQSQVRTESGKTLDMAAIRTTSGIFKRLIIQQVQSIWAYGVQVDSQAMKKKLGEDFDYIASSISENAALHSVCYGYWDMGRLQMLTVLEYFPFKDERTGEDVAGVRFWQLDDKKPMYIQLFEMDGWREFRRDKGDLLTEITPKRAYQQNIRRDAIDTEITGENYNGFPIIAMYANKRQKSELTHPIKSKIDLMDFISSGFGDDVLRTRVIYWVLSGFTSNVDDLRNILREIGDYGIVAPTDTSSADAKLVDLPYAAVQYALDKLEAGIYLDFMGMRLSEITGGSLTNVAIKTAQENLNLKTSDFEWQGYDFIRRLFRLQGIETENIKFKRRTIGNDMETMQMVVMAAPFLDQQTILEKMPIVEPDEVAIILKRKAMEDLGMDEDEGDNEDEDEPEPPDEEETD